MCAPLDFRGVMPGVPPHHLLIFEQIICFTMRNEVRLSPFPIAIGFLWSMEVIEELSLHLKRNSCFALSNTFTANY